MNSIVCIDFLIIKMETGLRGLQGNKLKKTKYEQALGNQVLAVS